MRSLLVDSTDNDLGRFETETVLAEQYAHQSRAVFPVIAQEAILLFGLYLS